MKNNEKKYLNMIDYLNSRLEKVTDNAINKPTTINYNNSLSFVNTNYSNPNILKKLTNKKYMNLFINNNDSNNDDSDDSNNNNDDEFDLSDIEDEDDNESFVRDIRLYERMHTLPRILGDFLINHYVKTDKSKQSMHLVDSARMKFVYAKLKDSIKNKIIEWTPDLKGKYITHIIIDPMLDFIRAQVCQFQKELAKKFINQPRDVSDSEMTLMQDLYNLDILLDTSNNRNKKRDIKKEILDYIAPHFQFNKELIAEQLLIE